MAAVKPLLKFLSHIDGRDKGLKLLQYSFKLWLHYCPPSSLPAGITGLSLVNGPKRDRHAELLRRMAKLVSGLSTARKIMRVSNWLGAIPTLMSAATGGIKWAVHSKRELTWQCLDLLGTLLGFLTNIADDVVALSVVGFFSNATLNKWDPLASQLWFASVVVNVLTNLRALFEVSKDAYRVTHDESISSTAQAAAATAAAASPMSSLSLADAAPSTPYRNGSNGIPLSLSSPSPHTTGVITTTPPSSRVSSSTTPAGVVIPSSPIFSSMSSPVASSPTSAAAKHQQLLRRWSLLELTHTDADRMGDHQRHSIKHAVPVPHPHSAVAAVVASSVDLPGTKGLVDISALKKRQFMLRVALIKLLADGGFCAVDVWRPKWPLFQVLCALLSAIAGSYQRWVA